MSLIVYNDGSKLLTHVSFDDNLVTVFSSKVNTSGFKLYSSDERVLIRDCSDFTTLYESQEHRFVLSNDGSVKPEPPEPPIPPEPFRSIMEVNGGTYEIYDFVNFEFKIAQNTLTCREIFEDVTEFEVDDIAYEHMVFVDAKRLSENYTLVTFRQKTEIEVRMDLSEEQTTDLQMAMVDIYEITDEQMSTNQQQITDLEMAICELYELIGG